MNRSYWQPLNCTAYSVGARVEPMQHGYEVWYTGGTSMLVRVIDGVPHGLDVCGQPDGPITAPTWIEPSGHPYSTVGELAAMSRRPERTPWMAEREAAEAAADRRAAARDEARDYRRRQWREKSFQIE